MHLQPASAHVSPSPEPTAPSQREDPAGVILVPEYFHQADMTHLTIMIGKEADGKHTSNGTWTFIFSFFLFVAGGLRIILPRCRGRSDSGMEISPS